MGHQDIVAALKLRPDEIQLNMDSTDMETNIHAKNK